MQGGRKPPNERTVPGCRFISAMLHVISVIAAGMSTIGRPAGPSREFIPLARHTQYGQPAAGAACGDHSVRPADFSTIDRCGFTRGILRWAAQELVVLTPAVKLGDGHRLWVRQGRQNVSAREAIAFE